MKSFTHWMAALAATAVLAGAASAADAIADGKVKFVNAEKKEFILVDSASKEFTFKLGDEVTIGRNGKESHSDLKADDVVCVCYDKGLLTWTAHYILVKDSERKDFNLVHSTFKSYDADKKSFTGTCDEGKECTMALKDAKVRLNMKPCKIEEIKVGDKMLAIVEGTGDNAVLKELMITRK